MRLRESMESIKNSACVKKLTRWVFHFVNSVKGRVMNILDIIDRIEIPENPQNGNGGTTGRPNHIFHAPRPRNTSNRDLDLETAHRRRQINEQDQEYSRNMALQNEAQQNLNFSEQSPNQVEVLKIRLKATLEYIFQISHSLPQFRNELQHRGIQAYIDGGIYFFAHSGQAFSIGALGIESSFETFLDRIFPSRTLNHERGIIYNEGNSRTRGMGFGR